MFHALTLQLKRLANGFGLFLSILMCVFWLVTSALLANLYREFCDDLEEPNECGDTDRRFIATPVLGFVCLAGWVRNRLYPLCTITCYGHMTRSTKR